MFALPGKRHGWPRPLYGILFAALLLRLFGINFGLPLIYHVDEREVVEKAVGFVVTGDLNPRKFTHPSSTLMYLDGLLYAVVYLVGRAAGAWAGRADYLAAFQADPTLWYLIARLVTLVFGVGTIPLAYGVGRRVGGVRLGLITALFLAVSQLHNITSQHATSDVPATFFAVWGTWLALRMAQDGVGRNWLWAGACLGFGVATKYPVALVALPLIVALAIHTPPRPGVAGRWSDRLYRWRVPGAVVLGLLFGVALWAGPGRVAGWLGRFASDGRVDSIAGQAALYFYNLARLGILALAAGGMLAVLWSPARSRAGELIARLEALARERAFWGLIGVAVLTFFLSAPYVALDYRTAAWHIIREARSQHPGASSAGVLDNLWFYLRLPLNWGVGLPIQLLAGLGLALILARPRRDDGLALGFAGLYSLVILTAGLQWERWAVPLMPFEALLAGRGILFVAGRLSDRWGAQAASIGLALLVGGAAVWPAYQSLYYDWLRTQPDTRQQATEWALSQLPPGTHVAYEAYTIQVPPGRFVEERRFSLAEEPLAWYRDRGVEYLFISSYIWNRYVGRGTAPEREAFYRDLWEGKPIAQFVPGPRALGPEIRVYRLSGGGP